MKVTLKQIPEGENEVIVRYCELNDEVRRLLDRLSTDRKIIGIKGKEQHLLDPSGVLYLESVDLMTYAYTAEEVYQTGYSLNEAEVLFGGTGFFRCSKSMVLNIYRIRSLKSQAGSRIDATMENGEHVLISRRYARELRQILKGGALA